MSSPRLPTSPPKPSPRLCSQHSDLMPSLSTRSPMTTARSSPTIRPSPKDSTPKVASPPLPFLGARTQREHQRAHPAIPAQRHRFPDAHTRGGPGHHGPTQQPAMEMSWLQDSKSAILRNQPTCCTYELNPRCYYFNVIQKIIRSDPIQSRHLGVVSSGRLRSARMDSIRMRTFPLILTREARLGSASAFSTEMMLEI